MKSQKQQQPNKLLQKWEAENMQKVMARKLSGVKSTIPSMQGREQSGRTTSQRPSNRHTDVSQKINPKPPGPRPSSTPYGAIRPTPPGCRSECSRPATAAQRRTSPQAPRQKHSKKGVDRAITDCMHSILKVARAESAASRSQASRNAPKKPLAGPPGGRVAPAAASQAKLDPPHTVRSSVQQLKDLLRAKLLMVSEEAVPDIIGEGHCDEFSGLHNGLDDECCASSVASADCTPADVSAAGSLHLRTTDSAMERTRPTGERLREEPPRASADEQRASACQMGGLGCVTEACQEEAGDADATVEGASCSTAVGYNDSDDGGYEDDAFEDYEDDFEDSSGDLKPVDAGGDCEKEYKDAVMDICNSLQELDVHKATRQQSRHTLASGSASGLFSAEFAMSMEDLVLTKSFLLGTLSDNQALVENFRVSYAGETVGEGGYEEDGAEHQNGYRRDPQYCSETEVEHNGEVGGSLLNHGECSLTQDDLMI